MLQSIYNSIRKISFLVTPEGEVKNEFLPEPKVKPKRRKSPYRNISDKEDYHKEYKQKIRSEGKDYQKSTDIVKKLKRKQKKQLNNRFNLSK